MKKQTLHSRALAVIATVGFCFFASQSMAQETAKTVSGELLDMACYMANGAHGEKHKQCAAGCIKGGSPMGLLTSDGKVYLLVENHSKKEEYAKLKEHAGDKVTVTGTVSSRGGVQGFIVDELKEKS